MQIAIWLSTALVFVADAMSPLGVVTWIFYLVPLILSLYEWQPRTPLLVASLATLFIGATFLNRPLPGFPAWAAELNRAFGVLTIWCSAVVVRQFIVAKVNLREQDWLRSGQRELGARVQGEQSVAQLGDNILRFLCEYLEVPVGALYVAEHGSFRRRAAYALGSSQTAAPEILTPGDTLLGQAIKDRRLLRFDDVPADYLPMSSALGKTTPRHLVVVPSEVDGTVKSAVELGFLHPVGRSDMDLLQTVAEPIAIAVRSAEYRNRQAELLAETQRQAAELQAQQEELRVTNEELEEQSRALKESQTRLEAQQSELEQTNSQLEEQARTLEEQRDGLSRAQAELVEKAEALERTNQYKSEFLANMSHELRTPLNSALILAKLLASNPEGNLTTEQVKFASTIHSSGNDLLALINDILDLSRLEAGHVDIHPEEVAVSSVLGSLKKTFQPIADQKSLALDLAADPDVPATLQTDPLRLQQILRNLLSNALKFTEEGQVTLRIARTPGERLAFVVQDTGVGIPSEQHEIIFEAFRQADGSTNRKYGGSGLGLTISRELARRMGGTLTLASEVGKGSIFTLVLPVAIEAAHEEAAPSKPAPGPKPSPAVPAEKPSIPALARPATPKTTKASSIPDDRDTVIPGERTLLVVEDDERFASILRDLARELKFRCLVATQGAEGLEARQALRPERHPSRHPPPGPVRALAPRAAQARQCHAPHPGSRSLGRRLYAAGAGARRRRLRAQAGQTGTDRRGDRTARAKTGPADKPHPRRRGRTGTARGHRGPSPAREGRDRFRWQRPGSLEPAP